MDWSYYLAFAGFIFMAIGTLIVVISYVIKGKDPNQGWTFILLGIALVVIFGIGLEDVINALGLPSISSADPKSGPT